MATTFRPNVLVTTDGTIVSLRYVESINQVSKDEDAVVDKLQDDLTFSITTVSGKTHTISVNRLVQTYKADCLFNDNKQDTYLAILDRWIHLLVS